MTYENIMLAGLICAGAVLAIEAALRVWRFACKTIPQGLRLRWGLRRGG